MVRVFVDFGETIQHHVVVLLVPIALKTSGPVCQAALDRIVLLAA